LFEEDFFHVDKQSYVCDFKNLYIGAYKMPYIKPEEVRSPKAYWQLIEVLLDHGEGECAYALGEWDGERRIGFRWNGKESSPIGNPQSRGLPTYTMLDPALHEAVIALLSPEKASLARRLLGTGLLFDGITISEDRSSLVLWDLRHVPPIVAPVECAVIRDLIKQPTISEEDCRLIADRNKEVLTEVAQILLGQNRHIVRENGVREIKLTMAELQPYANRFSSSVLDVAKLSHWVK
jgi:hypothetical protein